MALGDDPKPQLYMYTHLIATSITPLGDARTRKSSHIMLHFFGYGTNMLPLLDLDTDRVYSAAVMVLGGLGNTCQVDTCRNTSRNTGRNTDRHRSKIQEH